MFGLSIHPLQNLRACLMFIASLGSKSRICLKSSLLERVQGFYKEAKPKDGILRASFCSADFGPSFCFTSFNWFHESCGCLINLFYAIKTWPCWYNSHVGSLSQPWQFLLKPSPAMIYIPAHRFTSFKIRFWQKLYKMSRNEWAKKNLQKSYSVVVVIK